MFTGQKNNFNGPSIHYTAHQAIPGHRDQGEWYLGSHLSVSNLADGREECVCCTQASLGGGVDHPWVP
jgi:hypothetical protein